MPPAKTFSNHVNLQLSPKTSLGEALRAFEQTDADALAILESNRFKGVVTRLDVLRYAPSPASSLSKWEMNFLLEETTISDEALIHEIPMMEVTESLEQQAELLLSEGTPIIGLAIGGQFSHLRGWRELMEQLLQQRTTDRDSDLISPRELALTI